MTGLQRPLNFMSATVEADGTSRTLDYLSFATIDEGVFGKSSSRGFLVDGRVDEPGSAKWADTLLAAGHGVAKIEGQPRSEYRVTFRLADDDERDAAWANIREVRPTYNARMDPGDVRIILMELEDDNTG